MSLPRIYLREREVILLSGFKRDMKARPADTAPFDVSARDELQQLAVRYPDAVAFGYVAGKWRPAA